MSGYTDHALTDKGTFESSTRPLQTPVTASRLGQAVQEALGE